MCSNVNLESCGTHLLEDNLCAKNSSGPPPFIWRKHSNQALKSNIVAPIFEHAVVLLIMGWERRVEWMGHVAVPLGEEEG